MFDKNLAEFEMWENDFGGKCQGMRHKLSKHEHGISRVVTSKGDIYEYTFKDGKGHGLQRWIYGHQVQILLFKEGTYMSYFYFDPNFRQSNRHDPVGHIAELTPAFFSKLGQQEEEEPLTPILAADSDEECGTPYKLGERKSF